MNIDLHPPKREAFDLDAWTNTDPKGYVRKVEHYLATEHGLYMARASDHPRFDYLESWQLPALGLRVSIFHFTEGNELDQDFYIDIMTVAHDRERRLWSTTDLYLDITCRRGEYTRVVDTDELMAATDSGLLDAHTAQRALEVAFETAIGIAAHGHDLMSWLRSLGIELTWRE